MKIGHYSEVAETEPVEGIKKRVLIGAAEGAPNFVMRMFELKPGASTPYHEHPWEHEVFVVEGSGVVEDIQGKRMDLNQGYAVFVKPGEKHCFINTTDRELKFICVIPIDAEG